MQTEEMDPHFLVRFMREMRPTHAASECLPSGPPSKGGGGSGNAKKKQGPEKKYTVQQRYNSLFKQN